MNRRNVLLDLFALGSMSAIFGCGSHAVCPARQANDVAQVAASLGCADSRVLCLDAHGKPLIASELEVSAVAGETVEVHVVMQNQSACLDEDGPLRVSVAVPGAGAQTPPFNIDASTPLSTSGGGTWQVASTSFLFSVAGDIVATDTAPTATMKYPVKLAAAAAAPRVPAAPLRDDSAQDNLDAARIFTELRCGYSDVLCLREDGTLFLYESLTTGLKPPGALTVCEVSKGDPAAPTELPTDVRLTTTNEASSTSVLLLNRKQVRKRGNFSFSCVAAPIVDDTKAIAISVEKDNSVLGSHVVTGAGAPYHWSISVGAALVSSAVPTVDVSRSTSGLGAEYRKARASALLPTLMVNIYPLGHRQKATFFWAGQPKARELLGDLLAIQAGVTLDPTEVLEHAFLGLSLEPVQGFTAGGGLSLHKGERYINGFANGASGAEARDDVVGRYVHAAGYMGVAINQKLFTTIQTALSENQQ